MKLSLVIPCYNEEGNVRAFYDAAVSAFAGQSFDYELIFVDDGSTDGTFRELQALYDRHEKPVQVVSFSRNFGKEAAIYAGLEASSGDYVALIDADLQQRPEDVCRMMDILLEEPQYDCVAAYQDKRKESGAMTACKRAFYRIINRLSEVRFQENASDFRTLSRRMVNAILEMGEYHRFSKGIFSWVGFSTKYIPYEVHERASGQSKWSVKKLFKYAFEGIMSFSTAPLRAATKLGAVSALAAFVYLIVVIVEKLTRGIAVPGYATIVVLLLFLGGLQLLGLGIIGEYIGKIYLECKKRPIYIARTVLKSEDENENEQV
jgi:glycosyltransferase involved in cell wall biosynthesis